MKPLLVRDLMTVGVPTCPADTPLVDLVRTMLERNWEAVVVLDGKDGQAIGVVSQDEIVQAYIRPNARSLTAQDVMSDGVPSIPPDIPVTAAAGIMRDRGVRTLFLMHNAAGIIYPAAYISYWHILRHLAARDESELADLGIAADRQSPIETFKQKRDAARRRVQTRAKE
ncbi:MAG: CBS domain-containing protein [Anaerolineae bacterium]|nr:MAG: CBS domain-containing protein [Anaerolineae bacterium]